jgi:hypothetical protein
LLELALLSKDKIIGGNFGGKSPNKPLKL